MGELFVRLDQFELLESQVKELSQKLTESTKWQNALGKWLLNTFKLDVKELALAEDLESATSEDEGQDELEHGLTPHVAGHSGSGKSLRTSACKTPPSRKRKKKSERVSPQLKSSGRQKLSNDQNNVPPKKRSRTAPAETPVPVSVRTLRSSSKSMNSPTVALTRIPSSTLEQFNSTKKSLGKITIFPSEKVTSSSYLNSDKNYSDELEEEEEFMFHEYNNSEMMLPESVKEEPVCLDDLPIPSPSPLQLHTNSGRAPRNNDSASASSYTNEGKLEVDDNFEDSYTQNHQFEDQESGIDVPFLVPDPSASMPSIKEKKKRRRRQRLNSIVPDRPKKALTAYALFMRDYFEARQGSGPNNGQVMVELSAEWKSIDPERRAYYESKCAEDKNRYNDAIKLWKTQKAFVRKAPSAFALFLKATWDAEKAAGRNPKVTEMGKMVSDRWKAMSPEHKAPYQRQHEILKAQKETNLRELAAGNVSMDAAGNMQLNPVGTSISSTPEVFEVEDEEENEEDVMDQSQSLEDESATDSNNFGDSFPDPDDVDGSLDADNLFATI